MKRSPYTAWFHGDFLKATAGWTLLERAAYWMLLCAQWEMGVLPHDMSRLASIVGTDVPTLMTVWPTIEKKFRRTKAGLVNRRMDDHRRNFLEFRRRQSEGGKKGMASRYGNAVKNSNVIPLHAGKEQPRG